jgi:hypothetical protein
MIANVELPVMMRYKPLLFRRLISDTIQLLTKDKTLQAKPTAVVSYNKIEEVLRQLQTRRDTQNHSSIVPHRYRSYRTNSSHRPSIFDKNVIYVLAGGLGVVGRSMQ